MLAGGGNWCPLRDRPLNPFLTPAPLVLFLPQVADAIKQSSLVFGSVPSSYSTTARETTKMAANEIDYAGDFKVWRQALTP